MAKPLYTYKAEDVALYFIARAKEKGEYLTLLQLIKLVYLAHGWLLGIHKRPLIVEDVEAWQYGPVIHNLYERYRRHRNAPLTGEPCNDGIFDEDQEAKSIADQVFDLYGELTGEQLSTLTHEEGTPWHQIWHEIGKHTEHAVIPQHLIQEHFEKLAG